MYYSGNQIYFKCIFEYFLSKKNNQKVFKSKALLFIFQIKVLTDIGFFTEAFHELSLLNHGERIPWKIPAGYRKIEQMKVNTSEV